ncbi:MAG TPA: hypothetical protein VE172_12355 [Stackebrandtia sp.]|uniref:hypothetical protein n=1 Tax=Stackebrandtia sp. TaxID=2023065 RepID=UPI002D45D592|nr:hypothetical protein [Stackebrandtia sp.]HZE39593.1 hypothetical protein [Stackebrandtia sp.]
MTDPANLSFPEEYAKQDDMVTSPDGAIKARIVGGQVTKLEFKPNAYKNYSEIELAHQIVQLARLGNAARTRGYRRTLDKVLGHGEAIARRGPGSPPGSRSARAVGSVAGNHLRVAVRAQRPSDEHPWPQRDPEVSALLVEGNTNRERKD